MTPLSHRERELVAVGASIGAGCQPCTRYHVGEALQSGLSPAEVQRALEEAAAVHERALQLLAATGRRAIGLDGREPEAAALPADIPQALARIGAAGGCNSAALLAEYLKTGRWLGLSLEQAREALGVTQAVKKAAAGFLQQAIEQALGELAGEVTAACAPESSCCGPGR